MIVKDGNALLYSFDHENVRIEPWGRDALRVRVTRNAQFQDETWALLPEEPLQGEIDICEVEPRPSEGMIRMYANSGPFFVGSIRNGKITGKIDEYGCLSFFDEVGNVLLEENDLRMVSLPPFRKKPKVTTDPSFGWRQHSSQRFLSSQQRRKALWYGSVPVALHGFKRKQAGVSSERNAGYSPLCNAAHRARNEKQ